MLQLNNVKSGYSTGIINSNFQAVEEYINNYVLNRDGVVPGEANQMNVHLDMNSKDILNVGRVDAKEIGLNGMPIKELLDNTVEEATQEANRAEQEADRAKQEADRAERASEDLDGPFSFLGDYGPGLIATSYNQVVRDSNGEFWRVSGQVDLPYITTGTGLPEGDAFVPVGDAVLRQELASPSGAAMVGLPQGGTLNAALKFVTPAMKGSLQTAIDYAVDNGALLVLDEAEYETGEMLTANGPLSIYVSRPCEIRLTGPDDVVLSATGGQLVVGGMNLVLNGQNLTQYGGLFCSGYLPILENVETLDCPGNSGGIVVGSSIEAPGPHAILHNDYGYLKNCWVTNCGRGPRVYGSSNGAESGYRFKGEFELHGGGTRGTTGTEGNTYFLDTLKRGEVFGGDWGGDPSSSGPNIYKADRASVIGGTYRNVMRGPTVGKNCKNVTIANWTSINCSFSGFSIDARDDGEPPETEEYPDVFGVVTGGVLRNCGYAGYIQGKKINVTNMVVEGFTTNNGAFRVNGGDAYFDNIQVSGAGSRSVIRAGNGGRVRVGSIEHDSTNKNPITAGASAGSTTAETVVRMMEAAADFDLPSDVELVYLDLSGGNLDVDLSANTFADIANRVVRFVVTAQPGSNYVTFSIDGGTAAGSVNGGNEYRWDSTDVGAQIVAVHKAAGQWFVG